MEKKIQYYFISLRKFQKWLDFDLKNRARFREISEFRMIYFFL